MNKYLPLFLALALLVHHAHGANKISANAIGVGGFVFVSLTPTNVVLNSSSGDLSVSIPGMDEWTLRGHTEFAIPLDKEATFTGKFVKLIYTPVLLANQQKGFRYAYLVNSNPGGFHATVSYIALSDTPEEVDESEVVMIMENGEWMNIEDAESLEITKLRWKADRIIREFSSDMQDPEIVARLSIHPYFGPLWAELITKGLVTPNEEILAALRSAGFLPSNEEPDENAPLIVPEEPTQENENALPPPSRSASRTWLWWLALPAVAGVWLMARRARKKS